MNTQLKPICLGLLLAAGMPKSYAQVYGNPNGTASAVTSNYKKIIVPDSLQSFFKKIDDIHDIIVKFPEAYGPQPYSNAKTPQERRRIHADDCSARLLISYILYKDTDNKNPFYYDYMTAFVGGDYTTFLQKINQAMVGHFVSSDNYMDPHSLEFAKNGVIGDYAKLANKDFYTEIDNIWGGSNSRRGKAAGIYAGRLVNNIKKNDGYFSALDLAIIYSFGCYFDWTGDGTFGTINIDYQIALACLEEMEWQKYFKSLRPGYVFLYKALKAYDLLQLGSSQKDVKQLKQASDIYIDLWQTACDAGRWNDIFDELVVLAGYNGYNAALSFCDQEEKVPGAESMTHGTHFNPYFLISHKLDIALQLIKCCADLQAIDPNATLSNQQTPANYAAQVFRQFINDWPAGAHKTQNTW